MEKTKPYYRICRPVNNLGKDYLFDDRFSSDRFSQVHSYHLIENDLKTLFDYISPNDLNLSTFSHRIYELFFRCCTEFENNAKAILYSNGYTPAGANMNIANDYYKINSALKLNEYAVRLNLWDNGSKILKPFNEWNGADYSPIPWYRDYNSVKHNRSDNFNLANLGNLINSAAGLLITLYGQYGYLVFSPYQNIDMYSENDSYVTSKDCIFEIKPPIWTEAERYNFDWENLKTEPNPLVNFQF